ncbi:hypothetical protein OAU21_01475 [Gammaproteobacteria bacterium]|nr:hypothetical protein [Gammaproteobacteria bacterium]
MNGVLLTVDFENKKLLENQQQNFDKKKKGFYRAKKKICDGDVTIFQTANSGGIWHMRTYIATEEKYFQKSLRTKDIDSAEQRATYHPNSTKVDVESLQDCLLAYDLKQQGKTNVYIGGSFLVGEDELREYVRDGRSKSKTFDFDALEKFISKKGITAKQYDELNEKGEGVFFVGGKKRTASKNYLNVKANRMIAKAKANIKAVGEGQFPKATPQHLVIGKKHL